MRLRSLLSSLALVGLSAILCAQNPPAAYTILQNAPMAGEGATSMVARNGTKAVVEINHPAQGGTPARTSRTFFDLAAGKSWSWDTGAQPINCNVSRFSGDWGDPFQATGEVSEGIAKGELKDAGTETIHGVPTRVYTGASSGMNVKVWFDPKNKLVMKTDMGESASKMGTVEEITKVSFDTPAPALFDIPPACASLKPPPTEAEKFAAITGDDGANYVNANIGPGSTNSCTILVRVVDAKTMAPSARHWQAALDTTYDQNNPNPPHYEFGVGNNGTTSFSGGGLHEVTSQIHNDMLKIDNPPPYFNLAINVVTPGRSAGTGLVYRQCFAPVTMLYWVLKDPNSNDGDLLYAKAGKYAAPPVK